MAPVVGSSRNCLDRRYLSSSVLALNDLDAGNDGDLFGQAEGKRCGAHSEASLLPGSWHCYLNARVGVTTTGSRLSSLAIERGLHTVKSRGSFTGDFMRPLQIRARTDEDGDCLMRELAQSSPTRSRSGIQIELEERSEADVLGVLAAVETCLSANEIRSVRVELDGRSYMLTPAG